jgi:hypothetical protein
MLRQMTAMLLVALTANAATGSPMTSDQSGVMKRIDVYRYYQGLRRGSTEEMQIVLKPSDNPRLPASTSSR